MKKLFAAAALAAAFVSPQLLAQTAPVVDPEAAAAARELMELTQFRKLMAASNVEIEKLLPGMMLQGANMSADSKKLSDKDRALMIEKVKAHIPAAVTSIMQVMNDPKLIDELEQATIPLYTRHFTVAELKQLTALYRTPIGQKMLEKMPHLMSDSMALSQRIVMPRMLNAVQAHLETVK